MPDFLWIHSLNFAKLLFILIRGEMAHLKSSATLLAWITCASFTAPADDQNFLTSSSILPIQNSVPDINSEYTMVASLQTGTLTVGQETTNVDIQFDTGADNSSINGVFESPFVCKTITAEEGDKLNPADHPDKHIDNEGTNRYICDGTITFRMQYGNNLTSEPITLPVLDVHSIKSKTGGPNETRPVVPVSIQFGEHSIQGLANIRDRAGFKEDVLIGAPEIEAYRFGVYIGSPKADKPEPTILAARP